jgi:hypothetical protein
MPTHAILITWRNMLPKVLPDFVARTQNKYQNNFHRLYFDDDIEQPLKDLVARIPRNERLKIYVSGHGGTGIQYITDDTETLKKTVDELVDLLANALMQRNTSKAQSNLTKITMVSCLFARTATGSATTTPAAKLHEGLADWDVFVDLIARTESIVETDTGRKTISALNHYVYEPEYGRLPRFYQHKAPYTKILHTYNGDARVIRFAAYDGRDTYIDSTTREGRRFLWADYAVNTIVRGIHLKATGLFRTGPKEVTDEREIMLKNIVTWYDTMRNPEGLKRKLEALVDGSGDADNVRENFLKHRNRLSSLGSSIPKKAQMIRTLLEAYPS